METGHIDSLKKRYFYKLYVNIAGQGISLASASFILRGLGPFAYGNFSFLTNFFNEMVIFFDSGTSVCFYTKLSQRREDRGLVIFYTYFMLLVSLLILSVVVISHLSSTYRYLWPSQEIFYVYLAAGWGIFSWMINIFSKMTDAFGLTVPAEKGRLFNKILGLFLIITLYVTGKMNLSNYFYYQYFLFIILIGTLVWIMQKNKYPILKLWRLAAGKIRAYAKEFYNYSHPLFTRAVVGLAVGVLDRWLLQFYGGSIQQGFFGLSYQLGAFCFIFTGAMSPLLMREFSIAFGKKDLKEMASLFHRYIPLLFSVTAFFACFIIVQADKVVSLLGGLKYAGAVIPVAIMSLYPVYQNYGQLSSSVILAADQTRLHRNIDIFFMLLGLPFTYFLIAPKSLWGLNAGATGLAIKTMLILILCDNVYLFFNARLLKFSFYRTIVFQLTSLGSLLLIAFFISFGIDVLFGPFQQIIRFLLAGVFYSLATAVCVYFFPGIFGLGRQDIDNIIKAVAHKVKTKRHPLSSKDKF